MFLCSIRQWRPRCNFQPMAKPRPVPPGPAVHQCNNQSWRWESALRCNHSYDVPLHNASCFVAALQLPNEVEVHCSPEDCRAACCANDKFEAWFMVVSAVTKPSSASLVCVCLCISGVWEC